MLCHLCARQALGLSLWRWGLVTGLRTSVLPAARHPRASLAEE